uniref:Uncharacterized protein n=1 Tax=Anguilla anguilla TaxID=7936 RepID=A0A0E9TI12_ANGAN
MMNLERRLVFDNNWKEMKETCMLTWACCLLLE